MKRQSGFSLSVAERLYILAFFGAQLSFMPLLLLLLPRRVTAIAGAQAVTSLSWLILLGGIVASIAHVAAGAISDRWLRCFGSRRGVIAVGLVGVIGAYAVLAGARSVPALGVAIVIFQVALNLMFSPLGALMADHIPDARKGRVAGLLNAGLPLSGAMVAALAHWSPVDGDAAFVAVAGVVAALALPLLLVWPFGEALPVAQAHAAIDGLHPLQRRDLAYAWGARFLVQVGATLLISYLYLYVSSLATFRQMPHVPETTSAVGLLSFIASATAVSGAIAAGYFSDRHMQRRWLMAAAALLAAIAIALLARAPSWYLVVPGYALFHVALSGYLAIDTALVAQLVGGFPRRGAYLGIMNLTNTLPSVAVPLLALSGLQRGPVAVTLSYMLWFCCIASLGAAALVMRIRSLR